MNLDDKRTGQRVELGQRFGKLVVLAEADCRGGHLMYRCECDCGGTATVRKSDLVRRTRSCGCTSGRPIANPHDGYARAHSRVRAARGPASNYECHDCSDLAAHWSWIGGCDDRQLGMTKSGEPGLPFCFHVEHYQPRCRECHAAYDAVLRRSPRHWR